MPIKSTHILICRTDNIGDVILTLPIAAYLKKINPSIKISFLCRAYAAPAVESCTAIDHVICIEDIQHDLVNNLKKSNIDTIIIAQPDKKLARAAFFAHLKNRIGNARQKLYLLLFCNRRVFFSKRTTSLHEAQINFEFLRPFGITTIPSLEEIHQLYQFDIKFNEEIAQWFSRYSYNFILHPKSNGHGREWPISHYVQLAQIALKNPEIHFWITGSKKEGEWVETHAPEMLNMSNVTSTCGQLTLSELVQFIHQSDGLVASGTGPLHIASAVGQNCIGLFPPTKPMHPGRWAALGPHAHNLATDHSCSENCKDITASVCDCMTALSPDLIYQHLESIMASQK